MTSAADISQTLVIIANEPPFPANHGGRVDQWERYKFLKAQGQRLVLVAWISHPIYQPTDADLDTLRSVFHACYFFPCGPNFTGLMKRCAHILSHPPHVSSRTLSTSDLSRLLGDLSKLQPSAIVLDGLYGGRLAEHLATHFEVPLIYRSHNLEHSYMAGQRHAATSRRRKLALSLAGLHLETYEKHIHQRAALVLEISHQDCQYWQKTGLKNHVWMPPLITDSGTGDAEVKPWAKRKIDVLFLGNLRTPNNIQGVLWFLASVLPILRAKNPALKIVLAGAQPQHSLKMELLKHPEVELLADPPEVSLLRHDARILINPVLSGSGINLKNVEYLYTDAPIVTTSVGVQGFAEVQKEAFFVADSAQAFADGIIKGLGAGPVDDEVRPAARTFFSTEASRRLLSSLQTLLAQDAASHDLPADRPASVDADNPVP